MRSYISTVFSGVAFDVDLGVGGGTTNHEKDECQNADSVLVVFSHVLSLRQKDKTFRIKHHVPLNNRESHKIARQHLNEFTFSTMDGSGQQLDGKFTLSSKMAFGCTFSHKNYCISIRALDPAPK